MFIISFHFWFRDLLRELNKKYEVLLIILFLVFLLFLVSEGLLFVSFFWTSFHSLSSPSLGIWPGEGFYVPDPCELTFANTLLLSNAAISLGNAFISLEISCSLLIFFSLFSFILAWTFISLQIKEFRIMGLSINDSVYNCVFFFLTGLHFFHLVVGLLLLSLLFWSCSLSSGILPPPFFPAFNNSIVAGKKGGKKNRLSDVEISAGFPSPSLLPGHYAIIKGREEGRELSMES
jgi:heme/copper-type cytochrome/quinol oxidase subunit 3